MGTQVSLLYADFISFKYVSPFVSWHPILEIIAYANIFKYFPYVIFY